MEWDDAAAFEDRATVAFINRALDVVPNFTVSTSSDGFLTIATPALALVYQVGAAFDAQPNALVVTGLDSTSAFGSWRYGEADAGNLLGTIRTLDAEDLPPLNCTLVKKRPSSDWIKQTKKRPR